MAIAKHWSGRMISVPELPDYISELHDAEFQGWSGVNHPIWKCKTCKVKIWHGTLGGTNGYWYNVGSATLPSDLHRLTCEEIIVHDIIT